MKGKVDFANEFRTLDTFSIGSTVLAMDLLIASHQHLVTLALLVVHGTISKDVVCHMDRLNLFYATKRAFPT